MYIKYFRFNLQELGGAVGDIGTLLPLLVSLVIVNGLNITSVVLGVGLYYIIAGIYFRIPAPVQPMKAVAAIAISLGLAQTTISAAGLLMGFILLFLSATNLIKFVARHFPKSAVRGIQLSIGLILIRKGIILCFNNNDLVNGNLGYEILGGIPLFIVLTLGSLAVFLFFKFITIKKNNLFPPSLALLIFGIGIGIFIFPIDEFSQKTSLIGNIIIPGRADFIIALTTLVIPQLPLTLGNAVVGTWHTAKDYFHDDAKRVTPKSLSFSMGMANLVAGIVGGMPMCHGSGGLTAHYKMGARTAGASLIIGSIFLVLGLFFSGNILSVFSLIPMQVLGVLLGIVGVYHTLLVRDCINNGFLFSVVVTVAIVSIVSGNLAWGFTTGFVLHHVIKFVIYRYIHFKQIIGPEKLLEKLEM